jgi:hypothetical protein
LFVDLRYAAEHDVFDIGWRDSSARDNCLEHLRGKLLRMERCQRAWVLGTNRTPAPTWRSNSFDDNCIA